MPLQPQPAAPVHDRSLRSNHISRSRRNDIRSHKKISARQASGKFPRVPLFLAFDMKIFEFFNHLNFVPHFWRRMRQPELRNIIDNPIFIVGCGHSGTTLLLRIVGSHPNVHPIMKETAVFSKKRTYLLRDFDLAALQNGKKRWVEKTPIHIQHIDRIFRHRPHAKVLLILRDGRDVADSIRARKGSFEAGAQRWLKNNQAGEKWWDDPRVLVLKYEDLIESFDDQARKVLEFVGEDYSNEVREYHSKLNTGHKKPESVAAGDHFEYRMWQVSQPLFDGRARWASRLSEEEKETFKKIAGDMLIRYGYAADHQW